MPRLQYITENDVRYTRPITLSESWAIEEQGRTTQKPASYCGYIRTKYGEKFNEEYEIIMQSKIDKKRKKLQLLDLIGRWDRQDTVICPGFITEYCEFKDYQFISKNIIIEITTI